MALEIVVRSRRESQRSLKESSKADRRPGSDILHEEAQGTADQAEDRAMATNDNDKAWPLIPFPDGWSGC